MEGETFWQMKRTITPGALVDGEIFDDPWFPPFLYSLSGVHSNDKLFESDVSDKESTGWNVESSAPALFCERWCL